MKKALIASFSRYLVPGTAQRDYLADFGVPVSAVWLAPNAVDVRFYAGESQQHRQQRAITREKLGIIGTVVLFVGRLIEEKGIGDLICAIEQIADERSVTLLVVGSGKDEAKYKEYARERGLRVVFLGFQQQDDLPLYYALADIFAFPTHTDPWGLVLNEAMACELPVVASTVAGAADDLVTHGWNGFVHAPGDVNALASYLCRLIDQPDLRQQMGQRSRTIIEGYTPEKCAAGFANAIRGDKGHH